MRENFEKEMNVTRLLSAAISSLSLLIFHHHSHTGARVSLSLSLSLLCLLCVQSGVDFDPQTLRGLELKQIFLLLLCI